MPFSFSSDNYSSFSCSHDIVDPNSTFFLLNIAFHKSSTMKSQILGKGYQNKRFSSLPLFFSLAKHVRSKLPLNRCGFVRSQRNGKQSFLFVHNPQKNCNQHIVRWTFSTASKKGVVRNVRSKHSQFTSTRALH